MSSSSCLAPLLMSFSVPHHRHKTKMEDPVANKNNLCWSTPEGCWTLVVSPSSPSSAAAPAPAATACLWNPRSKAKIIPLPDLVEEHEIPTMGAKCQLTHKDATHPECVVEVFEYTETHAELWYCKVAAGANGGGIVDGGNNCKVGGGGGGNGGGVHGDGWSHWTRRETGGWKKHGAGCRVTTSMGTPCSSCPTKD